MKDQLTDEDIRFRNKISLKNKKRLLSKLSQHPDLTDQCIELKAEIDELEKTLQ